MHSPEVSLSFVQAVRPLSSRELEEVPPFHQTERLRAQPGVSDGETPRDLFLLLLWVWADPTVSLLSCNSRHVKGRVLVALADGTLAIFHRAEGIWG